MTMTENILPRKLRNTKNTIPTVKVETLCSGAVSLLRVQDDFTMLI